MMFPKYYTENPRLIKNMNMLNFLTYAYTSNEFLPEKYRKPKTKLLISAYDMMCYYLNLISHLKVDKFTPTNSKDERLKENTIHKRLFVLRKKYSSLLCKNIEDLFDHYEEKKEIEV